MPHHPLLVARWSSPLPGPILFSGRNAYEHRGPRRTGEQPRRLKLGRARPVRHRHRVRPHVARPAENSGSRSRHRRVEQDGMERRGARLGSSPQDDRAHLHRLQRGGSRRGARCGRDRIERARLLHARRGADDVRVAAGAVLACRRAFQSGHGRRLDARQGLLVLEHAARGAGRQDDGHRRHGKHRAGSMSHRACFRHARRVRESIGKTPIGKRWRATSCWPFRMW